MHILSAPSRHLAFPRNPRRYWADCQNLAPIFPLPLYAYLNSPPQAAAKRISQNGDKQNKSTQLRKYYDELSMWDDKIHRAADKNAEYQKSAPYIHMLRAKVAYASNRKSSGTPLVDEYFVRIFNHIINQIDSAETLHHAKLFYEAMLGFRKAQESK